MIEIYPNRLEGRPIETHLEQSRMTIAQFLDQTMTGGYRVGEPLALSVWVEGELVPPDQWGEFVFLPKDHVRLHMEPKGTDPFSITVALFAGVKAVFTAFMPRVPGTPNSPGQGESLNQSSVRGNKVKQGDPVREIFGRMKVYPDYLVPQHKYFRNFEEQWTELGLCCGVGRLQILADSVKIGETAILALGTDAEYRKFEPGDDVSVYSPFQWWHTAQEVGASSTGAAGLELTTSTALTPSPTATQFRFEGYTISIPPGGGTFPTDWEAGLVLRVVAPYTYTVTDGAAPGDRDIITGPLGMLNPTVGDAVEIVGANTGGYEVFSYQNGEMTLSYENGAPANELALGTVRAAIGPKGLRFRITSRTDAAITIERLDESGARDNSFPGFDAATLSDAAITLDASNYESGWRGPFPACPEGEVTDTVELDFFFPEGLTGINKNGHRYVIRVDWEVQWREIGTTQWQSILYSESGAELNQGGYTKTHSIGRRLRPEYRVRKTFPLEDILERRDTIQWYGLKARLVAPTSYQGTTTLGVKVRSSDRISAQTEAQVNVVATRILPGADGVERPTRSLRDAAAYVPRSLGYDDSRTNLAELNRLGQVWDARNDTFNHSYDKETTAEQALGDIFSVGFADLTIDRGQITPVRDEPRTVFEQMYTPQNFAGSGFLRRTPRLVANPDKFDGVQVTFTDERTWSEATVDCFLLEDMGRKIDKVTMPGVTNRDKAYQLGMRRRRVDRFRPDVFSWETEGDALVSRYLSYCAVADDTTGYPQSALLHAYQVQPDGSVVLAVGEEFDWSGPGEPRVLIRRPDGTASGPYPATRIDAYRLQIPPMDFVPDVSWQRDPPHVLFGTTTRLCYPVLITSIEPNGFSSARVEAVGYDARVYLDDDSPAP